MNIGEAAEASGVSAKMIRYYESIGLINPVERGPSGYRIYNIRTIHLLGFIRRARNLGFSIEHIGELLMLWQDKTRPSRDVKQIAGTHIAELEEKISQMQAMVDLLRDLADKCCGDDRPDCPILYDLASETGRTAGLKDATVNRIRSS
ncbi:Cu(I)-responsive transcriptional regulator [Aureimonas fodinaquatilis]|uniref:Cu(I)-responsive transcriptional regulator n=1 Tax=Aureimonas fodinaquatilis TaxID=2565783 RepID=A0A5B0DSA3_9HYPH|nr:Cu(I)-responsive transcriptional regulator [Aureimonas fodinaquatilis]KAA0968440.1 Cu(I)-responsive transcriptional regulator [Aureimonas fodinaquatilis]